MMAAGERECVSPVKALLLLLLLVAKSVDMAGALMTLVKL